MKKRRDPQKRGSDKNRTNSRDRNMKRDREYGENRGPSNTAGRNDVSWYTHYPNLSIATAQFPYPYRPGMDIDLGSPSQTLNLRIPGIMEMRWYPSLGWSETATDPASIVCKELFAKVRKAYGAGDLLCDAPDFLVYLMALDGIFSYLASLRRIYRTLTAWTPDNYILPDTVLRAMGLSLEDIQSMRVNRNQLWQVINELTLMSRKFTCPAIMDIMNRHFWMNDNVYTDAQTINSQMYVFHQMGFYKYAPQNMPSGDPASGLTIANNPFQNGAGTAAQTTVSGLYDFGRGLIEALVAWDDAYTINGYLSRAFEGTPNFIVDETPMDQTFTPVYSEEVLSQIENSRPLWAGTLNVNSLDVSQDVLTNSIICKPTLKLFTAAADAPSGVGTYGLTYVTPIISQRSDNPSVADNIIASRLHTSVEAIPNDTVNARVIAATEIPTYWMVWTSGMTPSGMLPIMGMPQTVDSNFNPNWIYHTMAMEAFDWHPLSVLYVFASKTVKTYEYAYMVGDLHNLTSITVADLKNLHKVCVYSEFNAFSVS